MNILGQKKDEFVLQAVRQILTDLSIGDLDLWLKGHIDYLKSILLSTFHRQTWCQIWTFSIKKWVSISSRKIYLLYVTLSFDSKVISVV